MIDSFCWKWFIEGQWRGENVHRAYATVTQGARVLRSYRSGLPSPRRRRSNGSAAAAARVVQNTAPAAPRTVVNRARQSADGRAHNTSSYHAVRRESGGARIPAVIRVHRPPSIPSATTAAAAAVHRPSFACCACRVRCDPGRGLPVQARRLQQPKKTIARRVPITVAVPAPPRPDDARNGRAGTPPMATALATSPPAPSPPASPPPWVIIPGDTDVIRALHSGLHNKTGRVLKI